MSCDNNQKAATKTARQNGIPKQASKLAASEATASQKESLPELLSGETANIRRLLTLKNSKATIPTDEVVKLFELEPDQPIAEAVEGLGDRFGPEAHLAVGKSTLGILTNGQEDTYGIQDVFITLRPENGSPNRVAKEEVTPEDRNIQHLAAIKTAQEQVSGGDVVRLIGMPLGQRLVHSEVIKHRFGEEASLALGKNTIGVIAEIGNDNYKVREIFVTPCSGTDLAEKIKLKPADRGRIATNIKRVHEAIKAKKKLIVLYNGPSGVRRYIFAPLDVADGKTENTKDNKYLWVYGYKTKSILSMRMDRVLWTKVSDEPFDPVAVTKETLQSKEPEWALPRDWKVEDDLKKDVANPTPLSQLKETIPVTAAN